MVRYIKCCWHELLEFISPDKTLNWSDDYKQKYNACNRKNLRL